MSDAHPTRSRKRFISKALVANSRTRRRGIIPAAQRLERQSGKVEQLKIVRQECVWTICYPAVIQKQYGYSGGWLCAGIYVLISGMNYISTACLAGLVCLILLAVPANATTGSPVIYDFTKGADGWAVEDDGVMGGVSRGTFAWDQQGYGVFSGEVSLDHNGGFSSVQYYFDPVDIAGHTTACLRVKGDGKVYRFIVEAEPDARHY